MSRYSRSIFNFSNPVRQSLVRLFACAAPALFLSAIAGPALAGDGLVDAGDFPSAGQAMPISDSANQSASPNGVDAGVPSGRGAIFGSPLSGSVSVIDHVRGATRLRRGTVPIGAAGGETGGLGAGGLGAGDGVANNHDLDGRVEDSGARFQSLFPSLDRGGNQATLQAGTQKQNKTAPPKVHPIWQKSPLGGYYDASGGVREVIKGCDLWRYGGTMADGITPAPSGPCGQNSMGYIKWQPIHGGPAGWY